MYTIKFADFNSLMNSTIMSEEDTLEVLLDDEFNGKIPKKFKNITPEEWAKYAFENDKEYFVTYFKDDKPYLTVHHTLLSICLSYYDYKKGVLFRCMHIIFEKGYIDSSTREKDFVPFNNGSIFLGQIDLIGDLGSMLVFNSQKKKNNVLLEEFIEEDGETKLIQQTGTADLSKHWFTAPRHYLDFEYLFDYQNLFTHVEKNKYFRSSI